MCFQNLIFGKLDKTHLMLLADVREYKYLQQKYFIKKLLNLIIKEMKSVTDYLQ